MKKLLTLLFTVMIAFAMAMPVFAQDAAAGTQEAPKTEKTKKAKKAKKEKKTKEEKPAAQ